MKFWSWQKENLPSIAHSIRTVGRRRATGAYARGLLGSNRDSGRNAIQSRRHAHALHRTRSRDSSGRVSRRSRGKLFRSKSCRLHARDLLHRPAFVWLSAGEDRLSICQCHPDDHCFDSADKSRVDRRSASIHRSLSRNHRGSSCCSFMAGTVCDCREERGCITVFSEKQTRRSSQSTLGSADRSGADQTSDRAGVAQE
jgi:hypothetical protein